MHQPYYKNVETNKFILPWVRLHGVKDYYDMVAILDKYPKIRQNFNLVPSLLLQIEEYINGTTDIFMDMSRKKVSDLNEDERIFILFNFFMANWDTMIFPYPRYGYLLKKRGESSHPDELRKTHADFSEAEMRDLQVWFNLTWIDPSFLEIFPELNTLVEKGEDFSEKEKNLVLDRHMDILKMIIPKYKEMWEKGQIEVSTTPFYHPILPLVYDVKIAKQCKPGLNLDFEFSHPEDAEAQIRKGIDYFAEKFGRAPVGMWPSEGSVSEDVISMIARNGIKWVATDQEILYKSLWISGHEHNPCAIYSPYVFNSQSGPMNMVFRNLRMSDFIGFAYSSWNPNEAADHFLKELYAIKSQLDDNEHVVNIILDGENCWEYYQNDGKDFLNALYERLSSTDDFVTTTIGDLTANMNEKPEIKKLWPGSWINHDFHIWIGHSDDRKSWKLLKKTRDELARWQEGNSGETDKLKRAWEAIYIAEGSDWNWWYGDDHSSKNDAEFDNLYRLHLMNVYNIIGEKIPEELYLPIAKADFTFQVSPSRFIYPVIDGEITHFYEWKGAGYFDLSKEGGAMHKIEKFFQRLYYGFNVEELYIRLDSGEDLSKSGSLVIELKFLDDESASTLKFDCPENRVEANGMKTEGIEFAVSEIFEAKIPFVNFKNIQVPGELKFLAIIFRDGQEIERIPEKGSARIQVPDRSFEMYNWKA
jgi:alpha-amylase/alpha-mannosidase (GH57 family)